MIIAADIGGTKVDIAAFPPSRVGGTIPEPAHVCRYLTKDFLNFEELLSRFLEDVHARPTVLVIGIAGPVLTDQVTLTNLNWTLDRIQLQKTFDCPSVAFLNDLEAHSYGALVLNKDSLIVLNPGTERAGNRAVIAAGTGLGEAFIVWDGKRYLPMACEGGHSSFAPQSELESDLLKFAQKRHHHVSAERLISGSLGFPLLRDFFAETGRLKGMNPSDREALLASNEVGPLISALAEKGDETCMRMMNVFVAMYGAEASNLVLKVNGIGGLYIGGGIARKIYKWMSDGAFMAAFGNKGRFRALMESTPIWIINSKLNALNGLASYAYQIASI